MRALSIALLVVVATRAGGSKWEQLCSARDPECRIPHSLRTNHAKFVAPAGSPKGHLMPVGSREFESLWDGEIDVLEEDELTPHKFWTEYFPRKPFLLRGAGKRHPAFTRWKRDDYIRSNFGGHKVKIEKKNEDRLTDYCGLRKFGSIIECPPDVEPYTETYINISRFMKNYRDTSFNHYVITQMPSDMSRDVGVVQGWNCGARHPLEKAHRKELQSRPWLTQLYEANLWINYNEGLNFSSSVIHYDMNHQMMCVYDGKKEWILWDSWNQMEHIPMWSGYFDPSGGRPMGSDDSPVDPERVDLRRFPEFGRARWTNTTMLPGDCMYLPAHLLHYVRSWGRNIAGMYMFQTEERYDPEACADAPTSASDALPLSDYDILWDFPGRRGEAGYNKVKMGYAHWKRNFRDELLKVVARRGGSGAAVQLDDYLSWGSEMAGLPREFLMLRWREAVGGDSSEAPLSAVYAHPAFDDVFRRIGAREEEEGEEEEQMLDTEVSRVSLSHSDMKKKQYVDEHVGGGSDEEEEVEESEDDEGDDERRDGDDDEDDEADEDGPGAHGEL